MILIIYAHPYPQHSHANKRMLEQAGTLDGVEIRSLYQLYPDFNIDIAAEQAALARADLVIWQHPMQWYSVSPLLKLWMDKVLAHGWAYGHNGIALRGKSLMWAVTTGGGETAAPAIADPRLLAHDVVGKVGFADLGERGDGLRLEDRPGSER